MRRSLGFASLFLATVLGLVLVADLAPESWVPRSARPLPSPIATVDATPRRKPSAIPDGYRIQIPRLGIDLPIREGDVDRDTEAQATPEGAAFHLPGTAIFGQESNTYIYAHARVGNFLALWEARVGDEVLISTPDRSVLEYVVAEIHPREDPDDITWVQPTRGERLTLQTSTGPDPEDPRFVVVALPRHSPASPSP